MSSNKQNLIEACIVLQITVCPKEIIGSMCMKKKDNSQMNKITITIIYRVHNTISKSHFH